MKMRDYEESFSTEADLSVLLMDWPSYYNPEFIRKPRTKQSAIEKKYPMKPVPKGKQIQNVYSSH